MDAASVYYLGVTFLLFAIFAAIWIRTYSRKHKEKGEAPKYRMMDDDWDDTGSRSAAPDDDGNGATPRPGEEKEFDEDEKESHRSRK